ncbi:hypothetical protein J3R82DRAFT_7853 [Butyriboletus roseoflavus]|nr:hypothetical protein J3R82DRAFT_7853 [Butyriboletus roseoflavus]
MASWIDVFSLLMTTLFFVGFIVGVLYVVHTVSSRLQSTKTSLEQRGITISRDGISLKTQQRFERDDYLDATQRGFVKALSAATVGPESHKLAFLPNSSSNATSGLVNPSARNEHERQAFGVALRRSHSGGHGEGH